MAESERELTALVTLVDDDDQPLTETVEATLLYEPDEHRLTLTTPTGWMKVVQSGVGTRWRVECKGRTDWVSVTSRSFLSGGTLRDWLKVD